MQHRPERVAELIQERLAELLRSRFRDPRLGFVTVTEVKLSGDLRHARVYVSVLGGAEQERASLAALRHGAAFLRHELATGLKLRHTPVLSFIADAGPAQADRIARLLDAIHTGQQAAAGAATDQQGSISGPPEDDQE
jgi:ribosome-binding factor A